MIAEVAPAVPAAAAASAFLIAFGLMATALVLWGLRAAYISTIGALLHELARLTGHVWLVGGKLQDALDKTNHYVEGRIADAAIEVDATAAKFWHAGEWLVRLTADTIEVLANETYHGFKMIRDHYVPHAVKTANAGLHKGIDDLGKRTRAADLAALHRFSLGIDSLRHQLTDARQRASTALNAASRTFGARLSADERWIAGEVAGLRDFTHRVLPRRISRLEGMLAAGALTAAALRVMTARMGWFRCTNVGKLGKAACRMDTSLLDSLLLDTLAIGGLISIEEFARALLAIEDEVVPLIGKGFRETRSLV